MKVKKLLARAVGLVKGIQELTPAERTGKPTRQYAANFNKLLREVAEERPDLEADLPKLVECPASLSSDDEGSCKEPYSAMLGYLHQIIELLDVTE